MLLELYAYETLDQHDFVVLEFGWVKGVDFHAFYSSVKKLNGQRKLLSHRIKLDWVNLLELNKERNIEMTDCLAIVFEPKIDM